MIISIERESEIKKKRYLPLYYLYTVDVAQAIALNQETQLKQLRIWFICLFRELLILKPQNMLYNALGSANIHSLKN